MREAADLVGDGFFLFAPAGLVAPARARMRGEIEVSAAEKEKGWRRERAVRKLSVAI